MTKPVAYRFDEATGINVAIYAPENSNKVNRTWQPFEKYRVRNLGRKKAFFQDTYRGTNGIV